jgi:hypothetical protein
LENANSCIVARNNAIGDGRVFACAENVARAVIWRKGRRKV